jgi:hypothetical protein
MRLHRIRHLQHCDQGFVTREGRRVQTRYAQLTDAITVRFSEDGTTVLVDVEFFATGDERIDALLAVHHAEDVLRRWPPPPPPGRAKGSRNWMRWDATCEHCGRSFTARRSGARFCCGRCRVAAHRARR